MNLKQSTLVNFFRRRGGSDHDSDSDADDVSQYDPSQEEETQATLGYWTRVKDVEVAAVKRMATYDTKKDLDSDRSLQQIRKGAVRNLGHIIFDPETFKNETDTLTLANYRLNDKQLLDYAKMATQTRSAISRRVSTMVEEQKGLETEMILDQLPWKTRKTKTHPYQTELVSGAEFNPVQPTRKRRTLRQLSAASRVQVVKLAASRAWTSVEVAAMFNIKVQAVYDLTKDAKKR